MLKLYGLRLLIFLLLALVPPVCSAAAAEALSRVVSFVEPVVQAGQQATIVYTLYNGTAQAATINIPQHLPCQLLGLDGQLTFVTASQLESDTVQVIGAQQVLQRHFNFRVPPRLVGPQRLSVIEVPLADAVLLVTASEELLLESVAEAATEADVDEQFEPYPVLETLFNLYQPYAASFSAYQPMHFLVGTSPENSKFQLSFKHRLFNTKGSLSQRFPWLQGLYFAYTQTSLWDLKSDSTPFKDTSYQPEIFFVTPNSRIRPDWLQGFFIQAGLQHESNGWDGVDSRSTNYAYIMPSFIYYDPATKYGLQFSPKARAYVGNDDETNPDLADYRGYLGLEAKFGKADSFVLTSNLRFAKQGTSFQADITYPISKLLVENLDLYFMVQYSNSLAESLLNYQQRSEAVRIGLAIIR